MNMLQIQGRLIAFLKTRVQNGELTERGFARSIGISQGHIHNVLKGIRALSIEKSDLILADLNYSLLDFMTIVEINDHLEFISARQQPVLDLPFIVGRLGPGLPWPTQVNPKDRHAVPCTIGDSGQKILTRLAEDRDMEYTSVGFNIALLEPSEKEWSPEGIYAVDRGHDTVLRRVRPGMNKFYLAADADLDHPDRWEPVMNPLRPDLFRGRVRWMGRERRAKPAPSK